MSEIHDQLDTILILRYDVPHADPEVSATGISVLGICHSLQEMAWKKKGMVAKCEHREYGFAQVQTCKIGGENNGVDALLKDLGEDLQVRLGDQLHELLERFHIIGRTATAPYAVGTQLHPEVTHSKQVISNFVAHRGGVDSSVAAKLMHGTISDRLRATIFHNASTDPGVNLTVVDPSDLFLLRLEGIETAKVEAEAEKEETKGTETKGKIQWHLQGTLYPNVTESNSHKRPVATIKMDHIVGSA
ncbi:hypothetical protein BD309DRAFT_994597 [Dichomitus squalens]|nr:hypothetical protein BD309DRAFT_994597 [Dichomitus squalens]